MPRKYNCPWPFFACAVFCAVFASPSVSAYAQTDKALSAGLAPHKALYEIQMAKNKNGSQVVNISGQMMYEWQPSCDAWVSNHKFNLVYEYADSPPMRIVSDYSTFESFDGTSLDFTSQRKRDGRLVEELRGHAEIDPQGKGDSAAVYSIPKNLVFDLPRGTLFPVNHTMNVLKKIREGKKFYNTTIFDGSDEDGPVEVNVFIGNPVDPSRFVKVADGLDSSLLGVGAWKLRLAFFPLKDSETAADYEMSLIFHENGVVSDMVVEYKDFSVTQKLVALEPLSDACGPGKTTPGVDAP